MNWLLIKNNIVENIIVKSTLDSTDHNNYEWLVMGDPSAQFQIGETYTYEQWEKYNLDDATVRLNQVPNQITARQARIVLHRHGLLNSINQLCASDPVWQIEWEYATYVDRYSPLINGMCLALGLTEDEVDALFKEGELI